jgi:hypothetical protein
MAPIARQEAGANLRTELFITAGQPGIEATPRDTERLAHPVHGRVPRCFAMKENFTSIPCEVGRGFGCPGPLSTSPLRA